MARDISISFALTAALTGGFRGAFQSATQSVRNVASAIRDMERTPVGQIGAAMSRQREKIKGLAGSLREAKATLATLQSQAQASGGATGMLARQIELAQQRVNNLNGAMSRQLAIWRNTTAQAATTGGSVRRLAQDYDRLSQRIERAQRVQAAMNANRAQGDALRAQRADLNSRLAGATMAATTVAAPIAISIGFEDQMAKVGAVSRASKDDLNALTAQARQLGRETVFSASQAAEGMQYLAMAGFNTKQVMAAMPGMLDLAAASGSDLGRTADIASNILSAFGLKAEQMGHVGDVLTAAFTASNTTLESLGNTMKYVGPVAKDAGASIEDAVAMAAMLGNVGISGSMAGTTSKAIFARLAAPPTEAVNALNALNIQTKDAQGNLRAVPDLLEEIANKTADMGTANRTDVFSKIFGLEPLAGASALAKQAAQTVDENGNQIVDSLGRPTTALLQFTEELKNASKDVDGMGGASHRVAAQMNATTGGSLRMLKSAWEAAAIDVGNLFLPAIRAAAGALSTVGNAISAFTERFPTLSKYTALAVGGIIALTAASVGIGLVMNFVRSGLNGFRGGLLRLCASQISATATTTASTAATGAFGVASRIAGAGAKFFAGGLRSILIASGVGALLVGLGFAINMLIDNWDAVVATMSAAWSWVTDTWGRLGVFFTELGKNLAAIFPGVWEGVCNFASKAKDTVMAVWNGLTAYYKWLFGGVASIVGTVWSVIGGLVTKPVETIKSAWNSVTSFFSGLWNRAASTASGFGSGILGFFQSAHDGVLSVWNGIGEYFSGLWAYVSASAASLWNDVRSLAATAFDSVAGVWNGAVEFFSGIADGITASFAWAGTAIATVWQGVAEFFGGIGQGISDSFSGIWQGIIDMCAFTVESVSAIWTGVVDFFGGIVDSIFGVFAGLFDWLKEKFAWVFSAIDAIGSFIGKVTGAVGKARDAAFGEGSQKGGAAPAANGAKATTTKPEVPAAPAAQGAVRARQSPVEWPPREDKGGKGKSGGGGRRSGAGGGGASRSGSSSPGGSGSGPVTVVTLDSGNQIKTQFIPAAARTGSPNVAPNANRASRQSQEDKGFINGAASALKSSGIGGLVSHGLQAGFGLARSALGFGGKAAPAPGQAAALANGAQGVRAASTPANALTQGGYALPQTPARIAKKQGQRQKAAQEGQSPVSIDLTQNFDLITSDAAAARKVLEAIKPDMEALIRRALDKINSDKRRTAYAQ